MLSILISSYNHEKFLNSTLMSAVRLGDKVKIICTDDGSLDRSKQILQRYSDMYENVHYIPGPEQNLGFSKRINLLREEVTTEYLITLNSDDVLIPIGINLGLKILKNYNYDFLIGAIGLIDGESKSIGYLNGPFQPQLQFPDKATSSLRNLASGNVGTSGINLLAMQNWVRSSSNILIKSEVFWANGGIQDYHFASDWALALRLFSTSNGYYSKIPFINYRSHSQNTISNDTEQSSIEVKNIFAEFQRTLTDKYLDAEFQEMLKLNPYLFQRF